MSTPFYDLASLVLVPSGYKASKVYAQKPLTTDGQLTFSRASTATRVNSAGLIETVSSNVPRLDYLGSTCPKLQLEPQRTNSAQYSEQANNAYWLKYQCSITANQAVSPDGYTNADSLTMSTNGIGVIYRNIGTAGAVSCFMKSNSLGTGNFYISVDGVGEATWNANGVKTNTPAAGTSYDGVSYGNGWYRFTYVVSSGNTVNFGIAGGTTGDSILLWGFQNEASASYATSYIPTTTAAVTRLADACSKTGISSLIGQTEGTAFAELTFQSSCIPIFIGSSVSGSAGEATYVEFDGSSVVAWVYKGGVLQASMSASGFTNGQNFKLAVAYKQNNFALYINGTQRATDTSGDVSTSLTNLTLHTYPLIASTFQYNGKFSQFLLFKTRLTNAQLAELTAL